VIFFIRIEAPEVPFEGKVSELTVSEFPERFGITLFRGAEVTEILDEEGNVVNEPNPAERKTPVGDNRVARVLLDPAQYHLDLEAVSEGRREVYNSFNIVMRRKPKENNFKAILETIRSLMNNEDTVVPDWLHDLFLVMVTPEQLSIGNFRLSWTRLTSETLSSTRTTSWSLSLTWKISTFQKSSSVHSS